MIVLILGFESRFENTFLKNKIKRIEAEFAEVFKYHPMNQTSDGKPSTTARILHERIIELTKILKELVSSAEEVMGREYYPSHDWDRYDEAVKKANEFIKKLETY